MNNRIHIKLGLIEFEAEGDSELIQQEREQFFSFLPQAITMVSSVVSESDKIAGDSSELNEVNPVSHIPIPTLPDNNSPKYESIVLFLREKSFVNDVDLVMGVSYYIDYIENNGPFTAKDIENKLAEARQSKPTNISHFINLNIKKGFIIESPERKEGKKAYSVSSVGIEWCESFTQQSEKKIKKKTTKTKQQNPTVPSALLNISLDELNLEKYCEISSLDSLDEQILVIIQIYSKEKNIEYFSVNDIVDILKNKFKISTTYRKVHYFFEKSGTMFDKKIEGRKTYYKIMLNGMKEAEKIIANKKK
ncbi:hypothetical protein P9D59_08450 [Bacillus haynesii]|uniref:hypothetical protein n=1 Tax=Bacillus haynesii TaxID=1925021 RepID=UPI002DB6CCE3|nr:hypothetical protein [Bacillus haynesii]MEC1451553.1 hypothetical protein [Bacillus haynesii]